MSDTLAGLIGTAVTELRAARVEDPVRDARILAAFAAGVSNSRLTLVLDRPVRRQVADKFDRAVAQRVAGVPMAHITGQRAFYKHVFQVTPDVLDPRADTEVLVEAALEHPFQHVLDLGTGSGCILLSLLAEEQQAAGVGTDLSPAALEVASDNATALGVADRCMLLCGSWYDGVEGRFDLIVSNPPYISADEMVGISREVRHEPRMALTDEGDGLAAYRAIIPGAGAHLTKGGRLLVEIGWKQAAAVSALFEASGFSDIAVKQDFEGRDRVVGGTWAV